MLVFDLDKFIHIFICDFLLLIFGYILYYFRPALIGDILAVVLTLAVFLNGVFWLPATIFRDLRNNWIYQACSSGMVSQHYYLAKSIAGGMVLFVTTFIYLLLLSYVFDKDLAWLSQGTLILFIFVPANGLVMIISSALSAGRERILHLVLSVPVLLPALYAGYTLFSVPVRNFTFSRAWIYWLISYDLVFLTGSWFLTEFLWEEFPR